MIFYNKIYLDVKYGCKLLLLKINNSNSNIKKQKKIVFIKKYIYKLIFENIEQIN